MTRVIPIPHTHVFFFFKHILFIFPAKIMLRRDRIGVGLVILELVEACVLEPFLEHTQDLVGTVWN